MAEVVLEEYRAWLHDSVSDFVRVWCPDAGHRRYEMARAEFVRRTTDDDASRRYASTCPVPGVDHTLYRLRVVTLPSGASVLAGIHFRGQATDYPFVGVFAQSRWFEAEEVAAAHAALLGEFAVFSPRATRWWSPVDRAAPQLAKVTPDQYLVMGLVDEIRSAPAVPLPHGWRLRRIEAASEVALAFAELYSDFHHARPDLAPAVPATTSEELAECSRSGALYACFSGSRLAGAVAAKPSAEYGVDAWLMWDIVLARAHCGKGLGPVLQRAVLDRLDSARAPLVAGTIDARNLPSLRTALRVGRRVVGTWLFLAA
ncbi:MAG TPA: hypothetical protein VFU02_21930 [Polyangiaceae bacterium]|nr:hypothetical protein [Polyangiaceae bacterium]